LLGLAPSGSTPRASGGDRVVCLATQGPGSGDEQRITALLEPLNPSVVPTSRRGRLRATASLIRRLHAADPALVVMEGTGISGGLAVMALRALAGTPYIVSSGDAVAPFLSAMARPLGVVGLVYEGLLCRLSSGFIGWSPYLTGRALTFGAPRAMTAANWGTRPEKRRGASVRERLGIPPDALVFGIVGSLNWTARYGYCYGWELVQAARRIDRDDVRVLVVGDGDGRARLEQIAGPALGRSVLLPGAVPRDEVADYLDAMDVASLPQSVDGVGAFRYTTKISEYLAAGLPVVTGQIPLAYDLDDGWLWRLPGDAPWDRRYVDALSALMTTVDAQAVAAHRPPETTPALFDRERQVRQVTAFVRDVLAREAERREAQARV
jgi:glycosyltransferase involved in cell wall biosynthesis